MFKEIIVLGMVTASIIHGKWLRPGLKRKWETFYGKMYFRGIPYSSFYLVKLACCSWCLWFFYLLNFICVSYLLKLAKKCFLANNKPCISNWAAIESQVNSWCSCSNILIRPFFLTRYRVRAAGIRCPKPLLLRLHVLVMEFIGIVHVYLLDTRLVPLATMVYSY